jgi:hypothetical protein
MTAPAQRFVPSANVVSRVIEGEAVLLDLASGRYLGMNQVATRVWELLGEGKDYGTLRAALLAEFEVPADVLDADLDQLLADMTARGILCAAVTP